MPVDTLPLDLPPASKAPQPKARARRARAGQRTASHGRLTSLMLREEDERRIDALLDAGGYTGIGHLLRESLRELAERRGVDVGTVDREGAPVA